jgi:hypothetical protein
MDDDHADFIIGVNHYAAPRPPSHRDAIDVTVPMGLLLIVLMVLFAVWIDGKMCPY